MPRTRNPDRASNAFTLIELLVVISIIALLIGLGLSAFSGAQNKSKVVRTQSIMQALMAGIDQFQQDFGYEPPLLVPDVYANNPISVGSPYPSGSTDNFEFVDPLAQNDAEGALRNTRYFSTISLTAYLVGNSDLAPLDYQPGNDLNRHDGAQGLGIRNPGRDRAWGGARIRDATTHRPELIGDVYPPYVEVAKGNVTRFEYDFRPVSQHGEYDPILLENSKRSFPVFVDPWGSPIRYYRNIITKDPITGESSVFATPVELITHGLRGVGTSGVSKIERLALLSSSNRHLFQSSYFLLSAGPDNVFASTGDPALDDGFARGALLNGYNLGDALASIVSQKIPYSKLVDSIEDNVLVSP
jgi:prepilin-type N-terminal cleavage/methylation domain-containing protein